MEAHDIDGQLTEMLLSEEDIHAKLAELARVIEADYADKNVLLVGVLKGAVMVMADLARELRIHANMDWMAVSSYGNGTQSERCRSHPEGPRHRHPGPTRAHRRGHHRLRSHAQLAAVQPRSRAEPPRSRSAPCCASPKRRRSRSTSSTSASTSRTSSSWATDSTTPRSTATCAGSESSRPTSTADEPPTLRQAVSEHGASAQRVDDTLRAP